jgi:hypothetical protein
VIRILFSSADYKSVLLFLFCLLVFILLIESNLCILCCYIFEFHCNCDIELFTCIIKLTGKTAHNSRKKQEASVYQLIQSVVLTMEL